ncbi:serine hydrolase domain-containing protein [Pseudonocardia ailaonensis]|uniref:Serine hydrolase domain-containing protein n=1 Tax=Pseudonocardia ailaonensis TaxID=367279 RepID=A0ABN2N451_9PSEU
MAPNAVKDDRSQAELELEARVRRTVDLQIKRGEQLGIQVAVYRHGRQIVSVAAGDAGFRDAPQPIREDSVFSSFSVTKGVGAAAVHMLADRGELDVNDPVAKYWPGFAKNGKGAITIAEALSHQGGLYRMPRPLTTEFFADWDAGIRWIEDLEPAWTPGTRSGMHALSWSWVCGGIVDHVVGKRIDRFVREDIAEPLGIADEFLFGIGDRAEGRLTRLRSVKAEGAVAGGVAAKPFPPDHPIFDAMPPDSDVNFNDDRIRRAVAPGANGHFSARALARFYGALAHTGEVDGARLLSEAYLPRLLEVQVEGIDAVTEVPLRKGVGFLLGGVVEQVYGPIGPNHESFGHTGNGGAVAFGDASRGIGVALTLNLLKSVPNQLNPAMDICEQIRAGVDAL